MTIHIRHEDEAPAEHLQIDCFDANNNEVRLFPPAAPERRHHRPAPALSKPPMAASRVMSGGGQSFLMKLGHHRGLIGLIESSSGSIPGPADLSLPDIASSTRSSRRRPITVPKKSVPKSWRSRRNALLNGDAKPESQVPRPWMATISEFEDDDLFNEYVRIIKARRSRDGTGGRAGVIILDTDMPYAHAESQ